MDIRAILNKLDEVALAEAISLDDVAAAVAGKNDEQERAGILNDLAWKHKLPGLYDPVSGGFVGKQSMPVGGAMGGRYSIAATGSERSDRALADLGLIPDNAKTSTALGRAFRGDDKGQYDQDLRTRSQGVVSKQKYEKFKTENLPKLKDLGSQLKAAVEKMKTAGPSDSAASGSGTFFGLNPDKFKFKTESSIFESLINEFQDEIIDQDVEERVTINPDGTTSGKGFGGTQNSNSELKKIIDEINSIVLKFDSMADQVKQDPETQKEIEAVKAEIVAAIKAVEEKNKADEKAKADALSKTDTTTLNPATPGNQDPTKGKVDYSLTKPEPEKKFPADYKKDGTAKSKEERLARVKELLAKANQPKVTSPAPGTTSGSKVVNTKSDFEESIRPESMSELMARIRRIAEGTTLSEELTAAEYKELQTYAAGLKQEFGDDPEILQLANRALNLPAVWSSDTKTDTDAKTDNKTDTKTDTKTDPKTDPTTTTGGGDVRKVQELLLGLGFKLPRFGADGKMGTETADAIKQFEKMAGMPETGKITPELIKALENGKAILAKNQLVQALTVVERIMGKYKIAESIDELSIKDLKKLVLENINDFTPSEQISILQLTLLSEDEILSEAGPLDPGPPLPGVIRVGGKTWEKVPGVPDQYFNRANPSEKLSSFDIEKMRKGLPVPGPGPTPPPGPGPTPAPEPGKPSAWQRLKGFGKKVLGKVTKRGAFIGLGIAGGVAALYNWLKSPDAQMDPADKAELLKNLEIIQKYAKDEKAVQTLPDDIKTRLSNVLKKADKLANMKTAPAPAAELGGNTISTPAA